jgi:hypothetical protein
MTKEKVPHVNLIIATPGHSFMKEYFHSFLATIMELSKRNISWTFVNDYSSLVADAREITLSGTKDNLIGESRPLNGSVTYDKILWIDSDIAWNPEDVIKLYESDKDIVTGVYLFPNGNTSAHKDKDSLPLNFDEVVELKELTEIFGTGFGFLCVKQGVFESLTRPWFQSINSKITTPDGKEMDFPVSGEDISWCYRVKEKGYNIYLDPTVQVTHHKIMKLTWKGIQA